MILCGAYCRYSHDDGDDSESVALQVQRSNEVAQERDWHLDPSLIFTDDGYSGREMKRRPGYIACLEAVKARRFPILISKDLDRCARGEVFHVGSFLQTLADNDVRLFEYLRKDFLRIDGEHALMASFRMYANRSEALKASERIKDRLLARDEANDGWTGARALRLQEPCASTGKPAKSASSWIAERTFGVLVEHPDEYPVLLMIGDLFLRIGSYNGVAMRVEQEKNPEPRRRDLAIAHRVEDPFERGLPGAESCGGGR